jgi:hypothetical protein
MTSLHPLSSQLRQSVTQARAIDRAELLAAAAEELDRLYNLVGNSEALELENEKLKSDLLGATMQYAEYEPVLRLVACGPRPDGTYNYCREACQQLAQKALSNGRQP